MKGDTLCITAFVEELLPKDKEANFLAFTVSISVKEARDRGFLRVDHPSSIKDEDHSGYDGKGEPLEKSDVVHDFLAFLTEQMIELNEEKQDEIRRFLAWLDKAIKVGCGPKGEKGIEALTGKTNIKNYLGDYAKNKEPLAFKQLLHILHKNRNRLGVNLSDSKLVGDVRDKYEESLARLLLIRNRLKKTDYLIDQIVYRLYGLTEEEIATIEGREENRIVGAQKGLS